MAVKEDENCFILKHKDDATMEEFKLELIEDEKGEITFNGLPEIMK